MKLLNILSIIIFSSFMLPIHTNRYVDWGKETFKQAKKIRPDTTALHNKYIRATALYDEFNTVLLCDSLWLSEPIKNLYTDIYSTKYMLTSQEQHTTLEEEQKNMHDSTSFYVLVGPQEEKLSLIGKLSKTAQWSINLVINDKNYQPSEIKEVDMEPIYCSLFTKKFCSNYRTSYLVTFPIGTEPDQKIALVLRSAKYEACLTWND